MVNPRAGMTPHGRKGGRERALRVTTTVAESTISTPATSPPSRPPAAGWRPRSACAAARAPASVRPGGAPPGLTEAGARAAAQADLGRQPAAGGLEGGEVAGVEIVDSATVVVTLSARSRPPFLPWGVIPARGFTIRAAGSARAVVSP